MESCQSLFWGIIWRKVMVLPGMLFDAALFRRPRPLRVVLGKTPRLKSQTYLFAMGIILGVVALAHFIRLFFGVDIVIAGWQVPLWL